MFFFLTLICYNKLSIKEHCLIFISGLLKIRGLLFGSCLCQSHLRTLHITTKPERLWRANWQQTLFTGGMQHKQPEEWHYGLHYLVFFEPGEILFWTRRWSLSSCCDSKRPHFTHNEWVTQKFIPVQFSWMGELVIKTVYRETVFGIRM